MSEQTIKDLSQFRMMFAALSSKKYFNFGGQGPMPREALDAIMAAYESVQEAGPFSMQIVDWICEELMETRRALAAEFGGKPDSWALTSNATEGCNIVLWGIDWKAGDHLLLSDSEHIGVIGAAENIAKRLGIEVSYLAVAGKSHDEILSGLTQALKARTKLVLFSHVLWNTGQVLPLKAMTDIIDQHGGQSLVDGAQSAGAVVVDVGQTKTDYYAICGHKWMCGPEGLGALYVRPDRLPTLQPTFVGWRKDMTASPKEGRLDGSRFEVATTPFPLLSGLRASIKVHRQFAGARDRERRMIENARMLRRGLEDMDNVRCFGDVEPNSGLVSFAVDGIEHYRLIGLLGAEKLILRTIPSPDALRASVHYFTTPEEISQLIEALNKLRV